MFYSLYVCEVGKRRKGIYTIVSKRATFCTMRKNLDYRSRAKALNPASHEMLVKFKV